MSFSFEIRCSRCKLLELWGLERAVRALTASGKLSPQSEFDTALFAELFLVHGPSITCPACRNAGTISVRRAKAEDWSWDDALRCEDCGAEIPEERLRAVPGTRRCLACQNEFESFGS